MTLDIIFEMFLEFVNEHQKEIASGTLTIASVIAYVKLKHAKLSANTEELKICSERITELEKLLDIKPTEQITCRTRKFIK